MAFKDILVTLTSYPDPTPVSAVEDAIAVAAALGAHITALSCEVQVEVPGHFISGSAFGLPGVIAGEAARSRKHAQDLLAAFDAAAASAGVSRETILQKCKSFEVPELLCEYARLRDLTIIPESPDRWSAEAVILVAGPFILKHMHNLSDEALCDRWVENPYFQYFCGEVVFRHDLPFDRSSLTRWRQRLGEEQIAALLQESLSVAHRTGAIETKNLERVVVDTTVQEKAIAHPTDARLVHRAIEKLVDLARGCQTAPELSAPGQAHRHHGGALHHAHRFKRARRAQIPAHPARPHYP